MSTIRHAATVAGLVVAGFVALFGMLWGFGMVMHYVMGV